MLASRGSETSEPQGEVAGADLGAGSPSPAPQLATSRPATTAATVQGLATASVCPSLAGGSQRVHSAAVSRTLLERKLSSATNRLRELREELAVADEQLGALVETADDARIRALVSETPLSGRDHREAQRHAEAMQRHRAELVRRIEELERAQDDLLDRLVAEIA